MKRATAILIIFFSVLNSNAHEEYYEALELSNVHIKVGVCTENSQQLKIARRYAPIINEFIKGINPAEIVFIQFSDNDFKQYLLGYNLFSDEIYPKGFPFSYRYDLGIVKTGRGLTITVFESVFQISSVLKLIEFGLNNIEYITQNQTVFIPDTLKITNRVNQKERYLPEEIRNRSINIQLFVLNYGATKRMQTIDNLKIDSLINNPSSERVIEILKKSIDIPEISQTLTNHGLKIHLSNDSIIILGKNENEIIRLRNLEHVVFEPLSESYFIFDSRNSFYYIPPNFKSDKKRYFLSFDIFSIYCDINVVINYLWDEDLFLISPFDNVVTFSIPNHFKPEIGILKRN